MNPVLINFYKTIYGYIIKIKNMEYLVGIIVVEIKTLMNIYTNITNHNILMFCNTHYQITATKINKSK